MVDASHLVERRAVSEFSPGPDNNQRQARGGRSKPLRFWLGSFGRRWQASSLATRFIFVASAVVGVYTLVLGSWIVARIEEGVISHSAATAAFYIDNFVEPHVQSLANGSVLTREEKEALDHLVLSNGNLHALKVWAPDGTVLYSNIRQIVGRKYPISENLQAAFSGRIASEYDNLDDEENEFERPLGVPMIEVYAPIRKTGSQRIICVAEFYEKANTLASELVEVKRKSWLTVSGATVLMLATLFVIVARGSRTITEQQTVLNMRVAELSRLLAENLALQRKAQDAQLRLSDTNERLLRQLGAELHDGPAQSIGFALLRLDCVADAVETVDVEHHDNIEAIRCALQDSLREVRNLSAGLALPELSGLTFKECVELAARSHERRTRTIVETHIDPVERKVPEAILTCAYRFVQEGLNNAFRHAEGKGQRIAVRLENDVIVLEVSDQGPGIAASAPAEGMRERLGVKGLRDRVESLSGTFDLKSTPGGGTTIRARFHLAKAEYV